MKSILTFVIVSHFAAITAFAAAEAEIPKGVPFAALQARTSYTWGSAPEIDRIVGKSWRCMKESALPGSSSQAEWLGPVSFTPYGELVYAGKTARFSHNGVELIRTGSKTVLHMTAWGTRETTEFDTRGIRVNSQGQLIIEDSSTSPYARTGLFPVARASSDARVVSYTVCIPSRN